MLEPPVPSAPIIDHTRGTLVRFPQVPNLLLDPLHSDGRPWRGADITDGLRLRAARKRKETRYPELVNGARGRLVLLGCEVGGRLAPEALHFLRLLATGRVSTSPALLRFSARFAWHQRWLCMTSVATQVALAASLAEPAAPQAACASADALPAAEVLSDLRAPPVCSRLPLR